MLVNEKPVTRWQRWEYKNAVSIINSQRFIAEKIYHASMSYKSHKAKLLNRLIQSTIASSVEQMSEGYIKSGLSYLISKQGVKSNQADDYFYFKASDKGILDARSEGKGSAESKQSTTFS